MAAFAPIADGPLTIGKRYKVPLVYGEWLHYEPKLWPVIGPRHEDADIIGFVPKHFHVDIRFIPEAVCVRARKTLRGAVTLLARPMHVRYRPPANTDLRVERMGWRVCRRVFPTKALREAAAAGPDGRWLSSLEDAHACKRLKGMICPHRGADLTTMPVIDGTVTCPLHGLRWNVETGALSRTPKDIAS